MDFQCTIPIFVLITVAIISNVSMVIHIFKTSTSPFGPGLMFKLIGISNAACGIFLIMRGMAENLNMTSSVLLTLSTALTTSYFLQLGFNVSLAFERYQISVHTMEYFSSDAKRKLEKKLSIAVLALSLLLGILFAVLSALFHRLWFMSIPIAISRIIGYFLLCILYTKLYVSIRSQNLAVTTCANEEGVPPIANEEVTTRRRKQLQHSKKFFIGITTSFFVLNLPTVVSFFIINQLPTCATWQGSFLYVSSGMFCFNMVFDSLWYFYMYRRSRGM